MLRFTRDKTDRLIMRILINSTTMKFAAVNVLLTFYGFSLLLCTVSVLILLHNNQGFLCSYERGIELLSPAVIKYKNVYEQK